ncbi:hypothetical protein FEI17_19500 [Kosakonia radicincitans]|uniref:hypothetical protein n=1 Tax=Kosakonia TaxID=1330547 RepID=UPI0011EE570E|nr:MULTISPECIES: hypothetical protein [Kosakonia]QEM92675.1 hypothetical protein FEI17_19500 [Kosakonia radicincitans]
MNLILILIQNHTSNVPGRKNRRASFHPVTLTEEAIWQTQQVKCGTSPISDGLQWSPLRHCVLTLIAAINSMLTMARIAKHNDYWNREGFSGEQLYFYFQKDA